MPTSETNPPVKQSNNTMLSILLNMYFLIKSDPQIKYYNVHDPPTLQIIQKKMRKTMKTRQLQIMIMMAQILKTQ
eukprot:1524578-Ditylum_brightwellii.AAC.1